jgi:hypothetical protein
MTSDHALKLEFGVDLCLAANDEDAAPASASLIAVPKTVVG